MTAAGAATFTTTHRMVDRVLGNAADVRTETEIAFLTSLTELGVHQIEVTDLTDHGTAVDMDHTDFTAGKLDPSVSFFLTAENSNLTGRTGKLGTGTGGQLNAADIDTDGDIFDCKAVARLEFGFGPFITTSPTLRPLGAMM